MSGEVKQLFEGKEQLKCQFKVPKIAYVAGTNAGIGLFCSVFFNIVNPVSGLIFGAVHSVMHILLKPGFKEMLGADDETVSSIALFAASYFTSVVIAISMSAAVGFSVSLFGGLILSLLMIPSSIAIEHIFRCAFNQELPQASDGMGTAKV
ncbi:MAG: hypothetical protein K940chlam2_01280 [Chlamydiae bacterium]|nr:hypothetical protein [Chlamydiota bacterium]